MSGGANLGTAQAKCYLEVKLTGGAMIGVASISEVDEAATQIVHDCVTNERSGGIVRQIGR